MQAFLLLYQLNTHVGNRPQGPLRAATRTQQKDVSTHGRGNYFSQEFKQVITLEIKNKAIKKIPESTYKWFAFHKTFFKRELENE